MRARRTAALAAAAAFTSVLHAAPGRAFTPEELYRDWPEVRYVATAAPCLRDYELAPLLASLVARHAGDITREFAGTSAQGRTIQLLTLGHGARHVLLWSQMHGDEPSATPALLDLAHYLLERRDHDPDAAAILDRLTLVLVPMLNPDGAAAYTRENAQAIDVNRDALNLATPEGRLLKALRDRFEPVLGFNLHDQNRRRTVGDTGVLASNAVLAVSGDAANTLTPGRLRAQRACVAIADTLGRFVPGGLARWDDEFNPRAFGDNLTAWGTPVVLIESGGLPPGRPFTDLTRLNFVAILTALRDLARDDFAGWDPARYDDIPENNLGAWADVVVRGGEIRQPGSNAPYRADLPFDLLRSDLELAACPGRKRPAHSEIGEVGDARLLTAGRTVDATGKWILPPFAVGVDGWGARRWLDAAALARVALLGVAEVHWRVPPRHAVAAEARARGLDGERRARVVVETSALGVLTPRLAHPPAAPSAPTLQAALVALFGEKAARELAAEETDRALWRLWGLWAGAGPPRALLAPERPASFLIVDPSAGGDLRSELRAVWIDGLEVGSSQ